MFGRLWVWVLGWWPLVFKKTLLYSEMEKQNWESTYRILTKRYEEMLDELVAVKDERNQSERRERRLINAVRAFAREYPGRWDVAVPEWIRTAKDGHPVVLAYMTRPTFDKVGNAPNRMMPSYEPIRMMRLSFDLGVSDDAPAELVASTAAQSVRDYVEEIFGSQRVSDVLKKAGDST